MFFLLTQALTRSLGMANDEQERKRAIGDVFRSTRCEMLDANGTGAGVVRRQRAVPVRSPGC